jgi:hypothetical protein
VIRFDFYNVAGWVERSDTHQPTAGGLYVMGFACAQPILRFHLVIAGSSPRMTVKGGATLLPWR